MAENKKQWFVVHTYSGYENKVKENLIRRTGTMNMENYIFLKSKILRNLRESEYAVLNYDDPTVRALANNTKAKVVYFSRRTWKRRASR